MRRILFASCVALIVACGGTPGGQDGGGGSGGGSAGGSGGGAAGGSGGGSTGGGSGGAGGGSLGGGAGGSGGGSAGGGSGATCGNPDGGSFMCAEIDGVLKAFVTPLKAILGPDEVFNLTAAVSTPVSSSLTIGLKYVDAGVANGNFACTTLSFGEGGVSAGYTTALVDSGTCTVVQTAVGHAAGQAYEGTFSGVMKKIFPLDGGYLTVTGGSYRFIR